MQISFASFVVAIAVLLCFGFVHAAEANNDQRVIDTAKISMKNVDRDLTLPEHYFLQACLRKAFQTSATTQQRHIVTLEVLGSTMIEDTLSSQQPHHHGRALDDWSWLYSYYIFIEYGCGNSCYSGGSRRIRYRRAADMIRRIEQRVCNLLRRGPYGVFRAASECHIQLDDAISEHSLY